MQSLRISISQVAPLVGLDAYNNFPRIVCELWRRYNPEDFKNMENRLKTQGLQIATASEMNDIWEADTILGTNILEKVKELNINKDKTSSDMVKSQDTIKQMINEQKTLTQEQKDDLVKKVNTVTNRAHGVNNEDGILAEFCRLSEKTIKDTQGWVQMELNNSVANNISWLLVGKYDAVTTEDELVEAKMRQKSLFKKMRDYENVQVQLYLHILQFQQAYLVESITNKKGKMDMYVNEVAYDYDYSIQLVEWLNAFTRFFDEFVNNDKMKEIVLSGDKDRKIFKTYEKEYLGIEYEDF
jgi:hypothetical protein